MSATPHLAVLKGARAVMTTEVDEGTFLSEALIKLITGSDWISARNLYAAPFDFRPLFKLFVAGNHRLVIRGTDEGMWRRIHLIPFAVTIPPKERDPNLFEKLRAELPGILNWALSGCLDWQKQRLDPPPAVVDAVAEYKEDMDLLGQWLAECCELGSEFTISGAAAYFSYAIWAKHFWGLKPWSRATFGRTLKERFEWKRASVGIQYSGFREKPSVSTIAKAKAPGAGAM
jgi:putative DNA primase/helicase